MLNFNMLPLSFKSFLTFVRTCLDIRQGDSTTFVSSDLCQNDKVLRVLGFKDIEGDSYQ